MAHALLARPSLCGDVGACYRSPVPGARTLKVKCPTWEHVEAFYGRKLRDGNLLTVRVPFPIDAGAGLDLALELPSELVMSIAGRVRAVAPAGDGQRNALQLELIGFTDEIRGRLEVLVAESREQPDEAPAPAAPPRAAAASRAPPVPQPEDAPVDERIHEPAPPQVEDVREDEREVFVALESELGRLRECAAHDVLGVSWDAGVLDIRRAYFDITKHFHPDVYAKYRSTPILRLAQEVFIHINKAYDRMRDAAVAAGDAIVAGPALLPHTGWLASFDDLGPEEPVRSRAPRPPPPPVRISGAAAPQADAEAVRIQKPLTADRLFGDIDLDDGAERGAGALAAPPGEVGALGDEARAAMADGELEEARDKLTRALELEPRNRALRALYHVVIAREKLAAGDRGTAVSQLESALAHDKECDEARATLDEMRGEVEGGAARKGLFKRLFR